MSTCQARNDCEQACCQSGSTPVCPSRNCNSTYLYYVVLRFHWRPVPRAVPRFSQPAFAHESQHQLIGTQSTPWPLCHLVLPGFMGVTVRPIEAFAAIRSTGFGCCSIQNTSDKSLEGDGCKFVSMNSCTAGNDQVPKNIRFNKTLVAVTLTHSLQENKQGNA